MTRCGKARLITVIVVLGLTVALLFHESLNLLGFGYPQNTFLFDARDRFNDFYNVFTAVRTGDPYSTMTAVYFPFAYVPLFALSFFVPAYALFVMLLLFIIAVVGFIFHYLDFLGKRARWVATICLALLSYPFIFSLDRANIECVLFIFLGLFFYNYRRQRNYVSALWLSAAIAMKLYPAVFVMIYLWHKKYGAVVATAAMTLILTFVSAVNYPGGISQTFSMTAKNLNSFKQNYVIEDAGLAFNNTYYGIGKISLRALKISSPSLLNSLIPIYTLACFAAFTLLSAFIFYYKLEFWKVVTLLTFSMLLLPEVSFDYKLIHALFPVMFFIHSPETDKNDEIYAVLFGLLLIPKSYLWLRGVSISVVLNPLLMTLIILMIIHQTILSSNCLQDNSLTPYSLDKNFPNL